MMVMFEGFPDLMTVMDVAKALGVSRNTAYEVTRSKGFPALRVGKQIRVSKAAFAVWLDKQSEQAMAG